MLRILLTFTAVCCMSHTALCGDANEPNIPATAGFSQESVASMLQRAADGNAAAQFEVGSMYAVGEGLPQDYNEAAKWYTKAAEQGCASAQFALGSMCQDGNGVPQDYKEAIRWYTKAAEWGNAEAQCKLGVMYYRGEGVPEDYVGAVNWYKRAAEQGYASAQYMLGLMYGEGEGVPQDYNEAYKWFILAAAQENEDAAEARDSLKSEMSASQIAEAQRRAREFKPKVTFPGTRRVVNPQTVVNETPESKDELRRTRAKAKLAELQKQIELAEAKVEQVYHGSSVEDELEDAKEKWELYAEQARCYKKLISLAERNPDLGLDVLRLKKKLIECEGKMKVQAERKETLRERIERRRKRSERRR